MPSGEAFHDRAFRGSRGKCPECPWHPTLGQVQPHKGAADLALVLGARWPGLWIELWAGSQEAMFQGLALRNPVGLRACHFPLTISLRTHVDQRVWLASLGFVKTE